MPSGWHVETECVGGSGNGDEQYLLALYRWRVWTVCRGMPWRRHSESRSGWVFERYFSKWDGELAARNYAREVVIAEALNK